jgi:hypothetical protein
MFRRRTPWPAAWADGRPEDHQWGSAPEPVERRAAPKGEPVPMARRAASAVGRGVKAGWQGPEKDKQFWVSSKSPDPRPTARDWRDR